MSVEILATSEATDLINALTKAVSDLRQENAVLKSERDELQGKYAEILEMYADSEEACRDAKQNESVTLRALKMACQIIRNKWFPMDSVQCITDRYIQQAKGDLQK